MVFLAYSTSSVAFSRLAAISRLGMMLPNADRRAITGIEDNLHPNPRKEKLGVRYTRTRHDLSEVEYM